MKKLIATVSAILFVTLAAKAEIGVGVTGAVHSIDASGTETTRQSGQKNSGSNTETKAIPELFIENIYDDGKVLGISYIPTREVGSKSRSDSNSDGDTGTYTADAEIKNVVQVYTDIPTGFDVSGFPIHGKLGIQHATLATLESLNSGSTYPDQDILGLTIGFGTKGDLAYADNMFYKAEATYTKFEDYESDSSAGNKVEAELEDFAIKFSVGYKF